MWKAYVSVPRADMCGYGIVKLSYEASTVAYVAFGHDWLFHHTERVAFWTERLTGGWESRKRAAARLAAWIHDIGRIKDPENHAKVGARWAKTWLKQKNIPEEVTRLVVDRVRNHGRSAKPQTDVGHTLRLADALSLWDPMFLGMYAPIIKEDEQEPLIKNLEKK